MVTLVMDLWAAQNIGQCSGPESRVNDLQAFIAKNGSPQWNTALDTDRVTINMELLTFWLSTSKGCFNKSSGIVV